MASSPSSSSRWSKPTLRGSLVTLRPIAVGDADAMWEMVGDAEGNDLTATAATFTHEQIADWCRTRFEQPDRLDLAIIEKLTGDWAGEVVLNEYDEVEQSAGFRISLRGPAWFGRGLGTEATRLMIDHGFDVLGLRRIDLEVLARNPRAIRVYEKVGFGEVRRFDEDGETWVEMSVHAV